MASVLAVWAWLLASAAAENPVAKSSGGPVQVHAVRGFVIGIKADKTEVEIRHEEISGYMPAMTMPFRTKTAEVLDGVSAGDEIEFKLIVQGESSWIEGVRRTGRREAPVAAVAATESARHKSRHPLLDYKFTNELGAPVSLNDFRGQVLVYTFFFTRCPVPEYCPRLSRNFEEATRKLAALPGAPTNFHLLSVSFDPEHDTPPVLREYGSRYQYDSNHWSFLTGPNDKIAELARLSGANYSPEQGLFTHNFKTLVIDPAGRLRMSYPIGGDLSDALVEDIVKAARGDAAR